MANDKERPQLERIVTNVCVVVVAAGLLWFCSSTMSHGTNIKVLQTSSEMKFIDISADLCELKTLMKGLTLEVRKLSK